MTFHSIKVGHICAYGPGAQAEDAASDLHVVCCVQRHEFLDPGGSYSCEAVAPAEAVAPDGPSPSYTESQDPSSHDTSLPEA